MLDRIRDLCIRFIVQILDWGRAIGLVFLGAAMVAVFTVGIYKVIVATWILARATLQRSESQSVIAVTDLLKGFEFFFLAPLGLVTFKALIKFVRVQVRTSKDVISERADKDAAERDVHQLKMLIGSLVAAFLITDLVSKVVSGEHVRDVWVLGSEGGVLIVTILYVCCLPRS